MGAGIGRNRHPRNPLTTAKSCFFQQLPLSSYYGFFPFLNYTCTKFVDCLTDTVAILAHKDKLLIFGYGNGVYPFRIFQYVIFVDNGSRG